LNESRDSSAVRAPSSLERLDQAGRRSQLLGSIAGERVSRQHDDAKSASSENLLSLPEEKATEVLELVDALDQDEDVQRVFHNLG
jgi:transcriptional/translational regulatory protein YebC/TACO1